MKKEVIILVVSHSISRLWIEVKARDMNLVSTRCHELVVNVLDPGRDWVSLNLILLCPQLNF